MQVFRLSTSAVVFLALGSLGSIFAQEKGGARPGVPAPIKITIPGFPDGGTIPAKFANTPNGSTSPAIEWSGVPEGATTLALILHDTDVAARAAGSTAKGAGPDDTLHWVIYNIPATSTGLAEGVPPNASLDNGSVQMKYTEGVPRLAIGKTGYFGPSPPPPTPHHYVFDLYALDTKLDPGLGSRDDLMKAIAGHVLAKGTYFGMYASPPRNR